MVFSYFTNDQFTLFIISVILLIASLFIFHSGRNGLAISLLFLGSLSLGFFIARLDPFLILWDEQYHALVAKNMLHNLLRPTLYPIPLLNNDYRNWTSNYIWLHKQPLFLWQIAISLKLFGVNELAVRIPSIILHALTTLLIYRIGKIAANAHIGFYGALFFSVAYFPLELVAGKYSTDHNDVSFLFYVTASFWAWFEYQNSKKSYWLLLIGFFCGCAVLVKWLVGLLIYPVWSITLLAEDKERRFNGSNYLPVLLSFISALIVFIPWQVYIFYKYPLEANYEFHLNTEHFFQPIEGHTGNSWFHFNALSTIYGSGAAVPVLLLLGLYMLLKKSNAKRYTIAIIAAIVITYGFYTFASTKMVSFCIIVSSFIFLGLGALTDSIINILKVKGRLNKMEIPLRITALLIVGYLLLDISRIANYHTDWKPKDNRSRAADMQEMGFIKKLPNILRNDKYVIFNTNARVNGNIPVMFYTNYLAYDFIPSEKQIEFIRKKSYNIAILNLGYLPEYIIQDKRILKIEL